MTKRMAKRLPCHAVTVEQCYRIARRDAKAYQRQAAHALGAYQHALCEAAAAAVGRIARKIRYGQS